MAGSEVITYGRIEVITEAYCYRNVPVERYEELRVADSKGKYCKRHILNRYPYQRIHRALRTAS